MNFPEKVIFRLVDAKTKKSVENAAILLILYAHKKNNYSIEAKISDKEGKVIFKKQDCIRGIDNSKSFYLMDYSSSLEECLPKLSLEVISEATINFVVNDRKKNKDIYQCYWDCSEKFLKHLERCVNADYVSKLYDFTEKQLWENKVITIELEPIG